jgi:hypothetical protein
MMTWGIIEPDNHFGISMLTTYVCTPYLDEDNYMLVKPTQNNTNDGLRGPGLVQGDGAGVAMDVPNAGVPQVDCCSNPDGVQLYTPPTYRMFDGNLHIVRAVYKEDDFRVYIDGDSESGITDVSGTPPTLTGGHLDIGYESFRDKNHGGGLIGFCRFYTTEFVPLYPFESSRSHRGGIGLAHPKAEAAPSVWQRLWGSIWQ